MKSELFAFERERDGENFSSCKDEEREKEGKRQKEKEKKRETERAEHFSHDHPLILNEELKDDGEDVFCYGCVRPILGPYYGCTPCQYFLHKSCAELPREITHPCHPEHPLTLLPISPCNYDCICDICREKFNRFIYYCSHCTFAVDINCASIVYSIRQRIEHSSHIHQLILLQKPAMFLCDACGIKHEGTSYLCTACGFWVNQNCASLPSTIKLGHHHHPLTLIYSIPYKYYSESPTCKICHDNVYRRCWAYYCSNCSYFVHVNCGTSQVETELQELNLNRMGITTPPTELSKDDRAKDLGDNLITLPVPNESIDLTIQFIKDRRLQRNYKEATVISHHHHPLIFFDKQIDDELCSKCNGCAKSISGPFYNCAQCKFSLHKWCAELRNELWHPCHPEHPLRLITQQSTNFYLYDCRCCHLLCNAFIFECSACKFYLDSKCASLPRTIKHEAHKHTLALRHPRSNICSACGAYINRVAFVCDPCNLDVCVRCVLLPGTIKHRYDEHPFTLTYTPVKDQPDEYYCEICEEEMNSKLWFYHCVDCDQSLHTKCIHPVDGNSNVKFGATLQLDDHQHDLTFVQHPKPKDNSPCVDCGRGQPLADRDTANWAFECAPCNFWIHFNCTSYPEDIIY